MFVSERLEMRLQGSPEPEKDKGYTMYPNWQLRMEITDAKALEARLSKMEEALDIERLAAIEHSQWMAWARTLMDEEPVLSASRQDRWQAMMVDYSELPEETKEYDREWARIVIGEALTGEEA